MTILVVILAVFALLAAAVVFCGGTDLHFHRKTRPGALRIACAGDSITCGALIPNSFLNSYPPQLGKMLGAGYHVENFGLNDRTAQASGNKPYSAEKEYGKSLAFQPDIVILMLGSNDTKPMNWASPERFSAEYRALLDSYLAPEPSPKVVLCTPPWATAAATSLQRFTNDIDVSRLKEVAEIVQSIGKDYNLPVIDMYSLFEGRKDLLSYDGLHPNARGAQAIARQIHEHLSTP